jgi:predicted ester cyclase
MSTTQEATNKATVRQIDDVLNSGDLELIFKTIDELMAPDALIHTPLRIEATGAELAKQLWARLLRAYPDLHVAIEDLVAEGDKVVSRNTVTGTHQGEHMGIPPTGKSVTYNEVIINRFADGRIVETWAVVDVLAQMRQLGAVPAAPEQTHGGATRPAA